MSWVAILLGAVASTCIVASALSVQRRWIVLFTVGCSVTWIAQYVVLERWATVALGTVTAVYGIATFFEERARWLRSRLVLFVVIAVYAVVFAGTSPNLWSVELIALVASVASVAAMMTRDPFIAKLIMLGAGAAWTTYHALSGAWGQLPGEFFYAVAGVTALVLIVRARRRGIADEDIPEVGSVLADALRQRFRVRSVST